MDNAAGKTTSAPERRRLPLAVQGADIDHDLRDAHHGSNIEHAMVNVNDHHAIVNRGKCPLKRERALTLTTSKPWPLQRSSTHGHRWPIPWAFQPSPWSWTPWNLTPWAQSHFDQLARHQKHAHWCSKSSINCNQVTSVVTFHMILCLIALIVNGHHH